MLYTIKAYSEREGVKTLQCVATDATDARQKTEALGYRVISAKARFVLSKPQRTAKFPLALFSQELLFLLKAGLSLLEAIETLGRKERISASRQIYTDMVRLLREGLPFSNVLSSFTGVFPPLYIATVKASEKTGDLPQALSRYLSYQAQIDTVKKKVTSAAIYPALLLLVGMLVIAFLLGYVVPKFSQVYEDLGDNLPLLSQLLLSWGRFVEQHGPLLFMSATGSLLICSFILSRPYTRRRLTELLWRIPSLGKRAQVYQLARLYRTLSMLLRSGTPLVTALDMVPELLQAALQTHLHSAAMDIREGKSVAASFEKHGLTTEVAQRMLMVGERSGNLDEMMERIAEFYDEDMARWVDWFTRLFEPLLMVFIGVVIGGIVVLMYFPIFELAGSIQ